MSPSSDLWDSFWAIHASKNNLFHRFLWLVRFLFSSAYARRIAIATGILSSANLMEIGCGSARTLHYLDQTFFSSECYAFDLSPQAIQLVSRSNPRFRAAIANAFAIPLESDFVDICFSIGLIEHFPREQAAQIVEEKIRVTKNNGHVAIMVPWQSSVYNLIVRKAFGKRWPFGEENPYHRQELALMMARLGLSNIQIHIIYGTTLLGIGKKRS